MILRALRHNGTFCIAYEKIPMKREPKRTLTSEELEKLNQQYFMRT